MQQPERLDPGSPMPLYYQLKEIIQGGIATGQWKPGEMIPSEHQLRAQYGVSRNTVQKALDELVQEGVLTRSQGKGTFVAPPKLSQALTGFYSFSIAMRSQGIQPSVQVISLREAPLSASKAKHLGLPAGELVTELTRVRLADQEPILIETSYLPVALAPGLVRKNFEEADLYSILAHDYGLLVVRAKEIFEPVLIREHESHWLEVQKGSPALLLDRIAYTADNRPVEFCRSIVRGDRCRFYTELL